jgi:hypothetical protein
MLTYYIIIPCRGANILITKRRAQGKNFLVELEVLKNVVPQGTQLHDT